MVKIVLKVGKLCVNIVLSARPAKRINWLSLCKTYVMGVQAGELETSWKMQAGSELEVCELEKNFYKKFT